VCVCLVLFQSSTRHNHDDKMPLTTTASPLEASVNSRLSSSSRRRRHRASLMRHLTLCLAVMASCCAHVAGKSTRRSPFVASPGNWTGPNQWSRKRAQRLQKT